MSYELIVRPEAESDLDAPYRWFEDRQPGLGDEFFAAVDGAFEIILRTPLAFAVVYREARRVLIRRFPFAVFYVVESELVSVLAVLHQASDPARWKIRVS